MQCCWCSLFGWFCLIRGTFSKLRWLFLLLFCSSFDQPVLLELVRTSFRPSLIFRCKSILRPPPVSSHPTNIIKPLPAESALLGILLSFFKRWSSVPFCLLSPAVSSVPDALEVGTDRWGQYTSVCSFTLEETTDSMMNVLCRAMSCLRLCLASPRHTFFSTAPQSKFS